MGVPFARLPPLRAVQVFEAVARTGSVARAAAELHVSSGAVSQQIRKIEQLLDLPLFERRGKGLELSSWGRLYREELDAVFDQLRRAHAVLQGARQDTGLVVSCLSSVAFKWLGLPLFDWQAQHPAARVSLQGAEEEPDLERGEADFRLTYGSQAERHLRSVQLHTDWVVPACAPQLLQGRRALAPLQLLALPLIDIHWEKAHRPPPGWAEWAASLALPPAPRPRSLAFLLSGAAIDAALAGRGTVLAPAGMLEADLAGGRLVVPCDHRLPLPAPYHLAWNRAALSKPFARELLLWLQETARHQGLRSAGTRTGG